MPAVGSSPSSKASKYRAAASRKEVLSTTVARKVVSIQDRVRSRTSSSRGAVKTPGNKRSSNSRKNQVQTGRACRSRLGRSNDRAEDAVGPIERAFVAREFDERSDITRFPGHFLHATKKLSLAVAVIRLDPLARAAAVAAVDRREEIFKVIFAETAQERVGADVESRGAEPRRLTGFGQTLEDSPRGLRIKGRLHGDSFSSRRSDQLCGSKTTAWK